MKKPIRPPGGWPWEAEGFTFSIPGFPPLFEPQELPARRVNQYTPSEISTRARNTMLARGDTGSITGGLSARSAGVVSDPARAAVKGAKRAGP